MAMTPKQYARKNAEDLLFELSRRLGARREPGYEDDMHDLYRKLNYRLRRARTVADLDGVAHDAAPLLRALIHDDLCASVEQPAAGYTDPRATSMEHAPEDVKLGALLTALSAIENLDFAAWERCNYDSDAYREMTGAPSLAEAASALRVALV